MASQTPSSSTPTSQDSSRDSSGTTASSADVVALRERLDGLLEQSLAELDEIEARCRADLDRLRRP